MAGKLNKLLFVHTYRTLRDLRRLLEFSTVCPTLKAHMWIYPLIHFQRELLLTAYLVVLTLSPV
jgi:hypothetical protein